MLKEVSNRLNNYVWLLTLIIVNFITYHGHYLGSLSFPFDFGLSYYGFAAFWISAVQHGLFPEWVPFQAYGYPLALNPQAYLFYAPYWFFALSGIPYTGHVHTILQCLHVLLGAAGSYLLIFHILADRQIALLGAIAFHFFGGFFSNSEHPDIIRGFALCPWLLWCLHVDGDQKRLKPRNLILPIVVCLISTGSYPGQIVSSYLLSACYLLSAFLYRGWKFKTACLKGRYLPIFNLGLLFCLGMLMALPHFYSGILYGDLTTRSANAAQVTKWGWDLRLLPLLIFKWDRIGLPYDSVMTSLYISIPAFIGLFFVLIPHGLQNSLIPWLPSFLLAIAMIAGEPSIIYRGLGGILSPLTYSRFPGTDYRGFVAVFLIVLSMLGIQQLFSALNIKWMTTKCVLVGLTLFLLYNGITGTSVQSYEMVHSLLIIAAIALIVIARHFLRVPKILCISGLVTTVLWDANSVIWSVKQHWMTETLDSTYLRQFGFTTKQPLPITKQFVTAIPKRPDRSEEIKTLSWVGYLNGTFHTDDYTGLILQSRSNIESNINLKNYMKEEWRADLTNSSDICNNATKFNDFLLENKTQATNTRVHQNYYGIDRIGYHTNGVEPFSFIENESYFPGWIANLVNQKGVTQTIVAHDCSGLRKWDIPPGGPYTIESQFEFPHLRQTVATSIISAIAYLLFILLQLIRRRSEKLLLPD